jgi:hypothetical protein
VLRASWLYAPFDILFDGNKNHFKPLFQLAFSAKKKSEHKPGKPFAIAVLQTHAARQWRRAALSGQRRPSGPSIEGAWRTPFLFAPKKRMWL